MLISFVHSLSEGTRPTRGHTKSASISAGHRSSSGVPPSDHSLLDPQPRNNSLLATADPFRQRYRPPMPIQIRKEKKERKPAYVPVSTLRILDTFVLTFWLLLSWATNSLRVTRYYQNWSVARYACRIRVTRSANSLSCLELLTVQLSLRVL